MCRKIRNVEEIFDMWLVIRETFEDGAKGDGDVEDCHELCLVLGETDVWRDGREGGVNEANHDLGEEG